MLSQRDLEAAGHLDDEVAYGGWPVDLHPPQGIFHPGHPGEWPSDDFCKNTAPLTLHLELPVLIDKDPPYETFPSCHINTVWKNLIKISFSFLLQPATSF